MTDLIISFDTEDYVNPKGADGILRPSQMVREAGFMPCHNVVAWLAQALVKWGRTDCIEELRKCEITTHSLKHSYHPTINEYTDLEDFDEAMRLFRAEEDEALRIIREIIGNEKFTSASPPGESTSYVSQYGYYDMGIHIYNGGHTVDPVNSRPVAFCNILNILCDCNMDMFTTCSREDILALMDKMAQRDLCIICYHPQLSQVAQYCDRLNFYRENNEGEWILSDPIPEEETKRFYENLAFFLERLKEDKRFNVVTYGQVTEKYVYDRVITPEQIPEIKAALDDDFFPVTLPESLCLSDILLACRDFLLGKEEHKCGKVFGFLDVPYAIPHPVKVTAEEMRESANQIPDGTFLPTEITVGGKRLGTADWLRAALAILSGERAFTVVPDKWQIDLNEFPTLRNQNYVGRWVHSDSLKDVYLSNRSRLQSWTIRLPRGTQRRIY